MPVPTKRFANRVNNNKSSPRKKQTKAEIQQANSKDNQEYYQNGTEWQAPRR